MEKKLSNKVALVTGGSRGIGAAIAKRLAQDGADVAFSYSSSPEKAQIVVDEIKREGVRVEAFKADQADIHQVEELVKAVVKKFGRLDILINNAGVFVGGSVDDVSADIAAFTRQQMINVTSVAVAVRTAVKFMGEGSRIILIGSIYGEHVPYAGTADYSATKSALIGYAKGWARDLGPRNITVNIVQPGHIDTDMNPDNSEFSKLVKLQLALGRYGKPEDIAAAVAFLASPEASYITSSILNVDGGFNA
ncbi:MAG: 3-oxoacyl-ACP reductase FabG [Parachlamydiaceae bacterium]|nr:3-oxoacyl-ACP reductase FabG [Parachlamydiaceae bacterium]